MEFRIYRLVFLSLALAYAVVTIYKVVLRYNPKTDIVIMVILIVVYVAMCVFRDMGFLLDFISKIRSALILKFCSLREWHKK